MNMIKQKNLKIASLANVIFFTGGWFSAETHQSSCVIWVKDNQYVVPPIEKSLKMSLKKITCNEILYVEGG